MLITWRNLWGSVRDYADFSKENDIFKDFKTPKSDKMPFDRKHFFEYLDYQTGDLTPFTDNAALAGEAVHAWSLTRLPHWQRILDVLSAEYEPLWNYNRTDEENTKENNNIAQNTADTESIKENEDYSGDVHNDTVGYDTNTEKTAGFDSGDLMIQKYDDQTHNGYLNEYDKYGRGHDTDRNDNEDINRDENKNQDVWRHSYGNIGVMSTQDLIKQEIEIAEISLYNMMIEEFKEQFCLMVY